MRLMSELEKGEQSAREKGWIDFAEIERECAQHSGLSNFSILRVDNLHIISYNICR